LLLGAVFVVALVSGGVALAVHQPPPKPVAISVAGTPVDHGKRTIAGADKQFLAYARANGGAVTKDSRCFFARLRPDSDDVTTTLYCGPVLFAHGSAPDFYLAYELTSASTAQHHLTLTARTKPVSPVPVPHPLQELERPDHRPPAAPPAGFAAPPAAALPINSLSTFDPSTIDDNFPTSVSAGMGSATVIVQLEGAEFIDQVGAGAETRQAAPGGRLLAFGVSVLSNGFGSLDGVHYSVGLQMGGGRIRELPSLRSDDNLYSASGDFVVVVPNGTTSVQLVFDGAGFRQTLAVPSGKPGAGNITLYAQPLTTSYNASATSQSVHVDDHGVQSDPIAEITLRDSQLVYFTSYGVIPSRKDRAFLHPEICISAREITGNDDACLDLGASVLVLSVDGHETRARNIAPAGEPPYAVFEVPAAFTDGTLIARGSFSVDGATVTFSDPFETDLRM
jgi:hypothetical protein